MPWKAGRKWRARTRVVAAYEATFQRHQNDNLEPDRPLSTKPFQLPAGAQPLSPRIVLFSEKLLPLRAVIIGRQYLVQIKALSTKH